MGEKFFTVSFDDGTEQDRKIIKLMEMYGIKGTFNISSGIFGRKTYIKRTGDKGKTAVEKDFDHPELYADHFILTREAAKALYSHPNVEVASHGTHHLVQTYLSEEEAEEEITRDFENLSELFGYRIVGHAFPKDTFNDNVIAALRKSGALYSRRVSHLKKPKDFSFDKNEFMIMPTCWHLDPFAEDLLKAFIDTPADRGDMVFHMWGHGYELDYNTERGRYEHLERLFKMVSQAKDIHCVKNRELFER